MSTQNDAEVNGHPALGKRAGRSTGRHPANPMALVGLPGRHRFVAWPAIPKQKDGDEPVWWFKDGVLVLVLSLMMFGLQWYIDEQRENHTEAAENSRQALSRESDDRRQREDNRLENLRFVRERASTDALANRPFAFLDLEGQYLGGLELANAEFPQARLSGATMSMSNLVGVDFVRAQFVGTDLRKSDLNGADFTNALLVGTDMVGANLSCHLVDAPGGYRNYHRRICAQPEQSAGGSAPDSDRGITQPAASVRTAQLIGTVLHDAHLIGVDFWQAHIVGADFRGSDLTEAGMTGVVALNTDFSCIAEPRVDDPNNETKPRCTKFVGTVLHGASLQNANLRGAVLDYVSMDGETNLSGADLTGATLTNVCYQSTTSWPEGFVPPPARMTDCMTDESLRATVNHVNFLIHSGVAVDAAQLMSANCAQAVDPAEWLTRWQSMPQTVTYRTTVAEPVTQEAGGKSVMSMVSSADHADSPASGKWMYVKDQHGWRYDGC